MLDTIQASLGRRARESSHLKPRVFHGKESEDPKQWLDDFERIAKANNWSAQRWPEIAGGYLEGIAADWYNDNNFVIWYRNHA